MASIRVDDRLGRAAVSIHIALVYLRHGRLAPFNLENFFCLEVFYSFGSVVDAILAHCSRVRTTSRMIPADFGGAAGYTHTPRSRSWYTGCGSITR